MIYLLLTWLAAPALWLRLALGGRPAPRRILVIQTAKIGDFVATTPVFRALRQRCPDAEIVALLHSVNLPLAGGLNSIDRIVALPEGGFRAWAGKRWLYRLLRGGFDAVVVLSPNLSTYLVPFWAGVPTRISVLPDRRQGSTRLAWPFLSHGEPHLAGRLFRETALCSLGGLGLTVDNDLLATASEVSVADVPQNLHQILPQQTAGEPLVGLGLGAGNRMKALSADQWLVLAHELLAIPGARLVLIGTAADRETAQELLRQLPPMRIQDTTGLFSLSQLPAVLARLDCFVGVDSGATYLADALGVPVVDFMGPADADDQRPLGPAAKVIRSVKPCAPCSHAFDAPYRCRLGTRACVRDAPLSEMIDGVSSILVTNARSFPPG